MNPRRHREKPKYFCSKDTNDIDIIDQVCLTRSIENTYRPIEDQYRL